MVRLGKILFPRELLTVYKGATPQELLRLYGPRVVGLILLFVVVKSFAESFVMFLTMGTMVCLVVGIRKPETFRWLFGDRTTKATVGWTFGALLFVLASIGSIMERNRESAGSTQASAPVADLGIETAPTSVPVKKTAAQMRADAAKERAARAQANAQQKLAEEVAEKKKAERELA